MNITDLIGGVGDLFNAFLGIIIGIFAVILHLLLAPIDALIATALPQLNDAFLAVGAYLMILSSGIAWAISVSGVPFPIIAIVATYTIFKLTVPLNVWGLKLIMKWWHVFKP